MPKHNCPFLEQKKICTHKRYNNGIKGRVYCGFKDPQNCKLYKSSQSKLKAYQEASKCELKPSGEEDEP